MLFEKYKPDIIYKGQSEISLPRMSKEGRLGYGVAVFTMSPNKEASIKALEKPIYQFDAARITQYTIDSVYKSKIGLKQLALLEKAKIDKYFQEMEHFRFNYISQSNRKVITSTNKSCVVDLSRWMNLFFTSVHQLPAKVKCNEFVTLLANKLADQTFDGYSKILLLDMNSWLNSIKECVIMNSRLLNNPLSIILYCAYNYPGLLKPLNGVTLMITNASAGQVMLLDVGSLDKEKYTKLKSKISQFSDTIVSSEELTQGEINAEKRNDIRNQVIATVRNEIVNPVANPLFDNITDEVGEDIPEIAELDKFMQGLKEDSPEESSLEEEPVATDNVDGVDIDDKIVNATSDALDDIGDDELDEIDTGKMIAEISKQIKSGVYQSTFMPVRSEKEKAKIARLTEGQEKIMDTHTMDEVKRKSLSTSPTGAYINTTNSTIQESKFVNFDTDYVSKCMERDIDEAVGILADADHKVFITNKEVVDSSTPMDLKKTYIYSMEDEKGNKYTIKFDLPIVMNGSQIFLNGTTKNILHQFILKPLVKTGPDTVQLVTANNKVFIRRQGFISQNLDKLSTYIQRNKETYNAVQGNCSMKNKKYDVPLDFSILSKYFSSFKIGTVTYHMIVDNSLGAYERAHGKPFKYDDTKVYPIGYDTKNKTVVTLSYDKSYTDYMFDLFDENTQNAIAKIKKKPKLIVANAKILSKNLPLILFMLFCEGFASVMSKANIKFHFVDKENLKSFSTLKYDTIQLADGYIVWDKTVFRNELLMNGLKSSDLSVFNFSDLEVKETYVSLIMPYYLGNVRFHTALDNYKNFLLDKKTQGILADFGYPTDLVSVLTVATGMLTDLEFKPENDMHNMRIRSSEVISELVYMAMTQTVYPPYRATAYKKKPTKLGIKQSAIIDKLLSSDTNMVEEFSSLNPALELDKRRAVTFKGVHGIQMDRAMTLARRAYNKSMLGTVGITSSPDAKVGVVRGLTLEPKITSTYGYIEVDETEEMDDLNSANLFTASELLQPLGITHDDPDRSAMAIKQLKYMIPIEDSDPVMIGNKVESIMPYLLTDEFVTSAKEDGKIIGLEKGYLVIEYKSGRRQCIDLNTRVAKNSSAGFWLDNTLKTDMKVGEEFKAGSIIAYNEKFFTKNHDDIGASMNLGALCKIAISSQWDIFEDSAPISKRLSEKLTTQMVEEVPVTLNKTKLIDYIAKVGTHVEAGDTIMRIGDMVSDDMQGMFDSLQSDFAESLIETAKSAITSKYTGEIVDFKIYTTIEPGEFHPSIQKVIEDYHKKVNTRNKVLDKYQNEGDSSHYKAGQIIKEVAEVVTPNKSGKVRGVDLTTEDNVLFLFYIKYDVVAGKGDKTVVSVCKSIVSHVFEEGQEPYSEYRPDEVIDTITAPLAVAARKVPAIFLTMFGNKLIIELKRQLHDIYYGSGSIKLRRDAFMNYLLKVMKILDPTGKNVDIYTNKFSSMSDSVFNEYQTAFFASDKRQFYLELVEYESDLKIENIKKCADFMKVPLFEYVAFPYLTTDDGTVMVSPRPIPVGYIHNKRMQQTLMKKSAGSTKIEMRSALTGQVTGKDKNARVSDLETYSLAAIDAMNALREFMGPRADNIVAKNEMISQISKDGYVSLDDLSLDDPYYKTALNTLDTYYALMGIKTNLVTDFNSMPKPK